MGTQIIKPQPRPLSFASDVLRQGEPKQFQPSSSYGALQRHDPYRGWTSCVKGRKMRFLKPTDAVLGAPYLQRCQCSEIFKLLTKLQRPRPASPQMMISKSSPHWPANKFLNWKGHADISSHNLTPQGLYVSGLHITICTRRS